MAWHLSGNWDGAPQEDLGQILVELTWAINERIDLINQTREAPNIISRMTITTQNGAKEYPVAADFAGMAGEEIVDTSQLTELQNGFQVLVPLANSSWLPSTYQSSFTVETYVTIRTEAGYDAWLTRNDLQDDIRPFLQLKEMLDLTFRFGNVVALPHEGGVELGKLEDGWNPITRQGRYSGTLHANRAAAWAAMLAAAPGVQIDIIFGPGYRDSIVGFDASWARSVENYGGTLDLSAFSLGSVLGTRFLSSDNRTHADDPTVTYTWGTYNVSAAQDFFRADWPTAGGSAAVSFAIVPPGASPFAGNDGHTFAAISAWSYFNVIPAMTYG